MHPGEPGMNGGDAGGNFWKLLYPHGNFVTTAIVTCLKMI